MRRSLKSGSKMSSFLSKPIEFYYIESGSNRWISVLKFVGPAILFAILYCIPRYFESYYCRNDAKKTYELVISEFRLNQYYVTIYKNVLNKLVTVVIPLLSLACLNYLVYKYMVQRRIGRDRGIYILCI